jgi:hypothetical protein
MTTKTMFYKRVQRKGFLSRAVGKIVALAGGLIYSFPADFQKD